MIETIIAGVITGIIVLLLTKIYTKFFTGIIDDFSPLFSFLAENWSTILIIFIGGFLLIVGFVLYKLMDSKPAEVVRASTINGLREKNNVEELVGLEVGQPLNRLPNGKFGYTTTSWNISSKPNLARDPADTSQLEMHKSDKGETYTIVFLNLTESNRVQLRDTEQLGANFTGLFSPQAGFIYPAAIPTRRIKSWEIRDSEINNESVRLAQFTLFPPKGKLGLWWRRGVIRFRRGN